MKKSSNASAAVLEILPTIYFVFFSCVRAFSNGLVTLFHNMHNMLATLFTRKARVALCAVYAVYAVSSPGPNDPYTRPRRTFGAR